MGKRNESDIVVLNGLREGERIALENPAEAAKRAKKVVATVGIGSCHEKDRIPLNSARADWAAPVWAIYRYFQKHAADARSRFPPPRCARATWSSGRFTRGELRAVRSATLTAPNLFGTVQVTRLAPLGALAREKDLIVEFDDSEVLARLEEKQLELEQIDEQIKKAQADLAIRNNQDQVDLLQGALLGAPRRARSEAQRAALRHRRQEEPAQPRRSATAAEAARKRHQVAQEQAQAELAVLREKRNAACSTSAARSMRLAQVKLLSPMSGLVAIKQNRERILRHVRHAGAGHSRRRPGCSRACRWPTCSICPSSKSSPRSANSTAPT